ncbi:MAG: flagellar basal body P-ring formation protein FlgA [Dinoroseobacter sp.]|nr:flagellar basal body P-ring formation protein FlgA [Dinoroseobacter sp.]
MATASDADIVAKRTIRAQAILTEDDLAIRAGASSNAETELLEFVGMETREVLYAGRPISRSQLGEPAIVQRNEIVQMIYLTGSVQIVTEGRALGRAALGETIRVMNLGSRTTVSAQVEGPARVRVGSMEITE